MKDGVFIFDNVIHALSFHPKNLKLPHGPQVQGWVHRHLAGGLLPPGLRERFTVEQFARDWSVEEIGRLVLEKSDTDMAMAQTISFHDYFQDGLAPVEKQYELSRRFPGRILFCGGVDPVYQGIENALREMERQVKEWGACSFKFYNAHRDGRSWRADSRTFAYPLYEKALELGVDVIQFHKGLPIGVEPLEDTRPVDLERPAVDFPELRFLIHHITGPYVGEMISMASRFDNVYLVDSVLFAMALVQPRKVLQTIGEVLLQCGPDKLIRGSDSPVWPDPQAMLDASWNLEMPEDLQEGYGYPPLTREVKARIFGETFARLMKIDLAQKTRELGLVR